MQNKSYKLKITLLSPVHIGTGEVYEPTNFIIDDGFLYEFDEFDFFKNLDEDEKKNFENIISDNNNIMTLSLINNFVKKKKHLVKKIYKSKVKVSKGIDYEYEKRIGKVSQYEGRAIKKPVINQFQIQRTIRETNTNNVYITGSSIKGAISTAFQEMIYKTEGYQTWKNLFQIPNENIFKNISISDTNSIKSSSLIAFSLNKERFEDDKEGPSTKIEVICEKSELETTIQIKDYKSKRKISIDEIIKSCNNHYFELFDSMFRRRNIYKNSPTYDYIIDYFQEEFYKKYLNFEPSKNKKQFLLRVGKHSGARAVTIDGMRDIRVKVSGGGSRRKPNKWENLKEESTTWLLGENEDSMDTLLPFGWVLCELKGGVI